MHPSASRILPFTHPFIAVPPAPSHSSRNRLSHSTRFTADLMLHSRFQFACLPILQTTTKLYLALYSMSQNQPLFAPRAFLEFHHSHLGFPWPDQGPPATNNPPPIYPSTHPLPSHEPRVTAHGSRKPPLTRHATPPPRHTSLSLPLRLPPNTPDYY
jgi:hypothetical protein